MDAEVVVVGAGVSGLATARALTANGRSVMVLEARDRMGGRAHSPLLEGYPVDLGASWVWDHEQHVHGLLTELGIPTYLPWTDGIGVAEQRGQRLTGRFPQSHSPERRIVGGVGALATALAAAVPHVSFESPVMAMEQTQDGVRVHAPSGTIAAQAVVVALPPALFARRIEVQGLDDQLRELLRQVPVWMGDVAKVVSVWDTPWWREQGWSGRAFSDRGPMSEVHELSGPNADPAALFGFVPRMWATDDLVSRVNDQWQRLFGAAAPPPRTTVVQAWWNEPHTYPDDGQANQAVRLFGHAQLQAPHWDGRLHFVSCETSAVSPGHLDGAIERAHTVSNTIERHLGGGS